MDRNFIKTKKATKSNIEGIVALWGKDNIIYFCKSEDYVFPADVVGVYEDKVLYQTGDTDLYYYITGSESHEKAHEKRLRKLIFGDEN